MRLQGSTGVHMPEWVEVAGNGRSKGTPKRVRVIQHGSCQSAETPSFAEFTSRTSFFETSPVPPAGEVSNFEPCRRGGARNNRLRESLELTKHQIANLSAAMIHAGEIGLPFTRMITVHWEAAGISLSGMAKATGRLTDLLTKALSRNGSATSWLWVHENGHGKGGHCHLLVHVPAELAPIVRTAMRGWLRRITGKPYKARVVRSTSIGPRLGLELCNPDLFAANLEAAFCYVVKGASHEAAEHFDLPRCEHQGRVVGKRCGTSQNIGAKARAADVSREVKD